MSRVESASRMMQVPFHQNKEPEKPVEKDFETVLDEAITKQKRIHGDFECLKARQAVRLDNLYGDGAFKWR